jgi:predicted Zn-dependent protease
MNVDTTVAMMHANNPQLNANQAFSEDDKKLKEQTDAFEAVFLKQYLDMALKENNSLYPKTPGSDIYKSMQIDIYSKQSAGQFGFSEILFDYLKRQQK